MEAGEGGEGDAEGGGVPVPWQGQPGQLASLARSHSQGRSGWEQLLTCACEGFRVNSLFSHGLERVIRQRVPCRPSQKSSRTTTTFSAHARALRGMAWKSCGLTF